MRSPMLTFAAAAALASTGCGYPHTFVGAVAAMPADCGPQSAAPDAALAGATITARCPGNTAPALSFTADARGRLRGQLERPLPLACELVVSKDGYAPRTYAMKDVCAVTREATCEAVTVSARLARATKRAP